MSIKRIMSFVVVGLILFIFISMFLPFYSFDSYYSISENFWDTFQNGHMNIIITIELVVALVFLILQGCGVVKDSGLAMLPLGYLFNICLQFLLADNGVDFRIGFYLIFILSILSFAAIAVGSSLKDDESKKPRYGMPGGYPPPPRFDPQTGQPIYEAPKQIVGYDPQTGQPIFK